MKNKLLRLAELIQNGFPEDLMELFADSENNSLEERLTMASKAISHHRNHSDQLWLKAGKKKTAEVRRIAAQAELAAFLFAYLSGDAKEYADSALDALQTLGRQAEESLIRRLARR